MKQKLAQGVLVATVLLASSQLPAAAFYPVPETLDVQSVAGFYQIGNGNGQFVEAQPDTGSFSLQTDKLTLTPKGYLKYPPGLLQPIAQDYIYQGPSYGYFYAGYGLWQQANPSAPLVWGVYAAGSSENYSLPKSGSATFCGFAGVWALAKDGDAPGGMSSSHVAIQTTWQHSTGSATINTFTIPEFGAATSAGYAISGNGAATVTFSAVGPNGLLNGGKATALVHFYGPGSIEVSGTFSGPWRGGLMAGGFVGWLVPGNPGPRAC